MISEAMSGAQQAASMQKTETSNRTQKTKVSGKTIGEPQLSEQAAKYYEELKKKYSNMDFILVSADQKEYAKSKAASYANANKMVVLIDEEKIEKMASDENYRKQYEGIIANAASGLSQLGKQLSATGAKVKGYGEMKYPFIEYLSYRLKKYGKKAYPYLAILEEEVEKMGVEVAEVAQKEHFDIATNKISMGNAITSIKTLNRISMAEIFEEINGVEDILRQDPAGVYEKMDHQT